MSRGLLIAATLLNLPWSQALAMPLALPEPTVLHLQLVASKAQAKTLKVTKHWPKACAELGKQLSAGNGPWGLGLFGSFDCAVSRNAGKPPAGWSLRISQDTDTVRLQLFASGFAKALATTKFHASALTLAVLKKPDLAELVAADLLEQMPMLGAISASLYHADSQTIPAISGVEASKLPPPPAALDIYTLSFDTAAGLWRPHMVTTAKLAATNTAEPRQWQLAQKLPEGGDPLWIGDGAGRNANQPELGQSLASTSDALIGREAMLLQESWKKLHDLVSNTLNAGYAGIRYGHSVFLGQLVSQISLFSLLLELRGSPFDGLRMYYDLWPRVRDSASVGAVSFAGDRVVAGWSFSHDTSGLVDRIDLVPKIGRWTMDVEFKAINPQGGVDDVQFDMDGALSLGLEAGVEKRIGLAQLRLWLANDFGYHPFLKGEKVHINDARGGFDVLTKGPSLNFFGKDLNLTFLVFALFENMDLTKSGATVGPNQAAVQAVNFQIAYLGGGFALAW